MRIHPNSSGLFKQTMYFTKDDIDQMCLEALKKAALLPDQPSAIRIDRFVEKHFQSQIIYDDMKDGVLGCTAFKPNGAVEAVFVASSLEDGTVAGKRRERSTLAHESGHGLMHSLLFMDDGCRQSLSGFEDQNLNIKDRRILCREADFRNTSEKKFDGRWWEYQANRAIGGFLLPKRLVVKAIEPFLSVSGGLGIKILTATAFNQAQAEVAKIFDVNPVVAGIRLREMYPQEGGQQML